jgi:hypothetical protein
MGIQQDRNEIATGLSEHFGGKRQFHAPVLDGFPDQHGHNEGARPFPGKTIAISFLSHCIPILPPWLVMNILFYTHPFIALSIFLDVIILWSGQKLALQNKLNLMKLASTLSAHSVLNYHPWCSWKLRQLETTKQPPHISHNFKTNPFFSREISIW